MYYWITGGTTVKHMDLTEPLLLPADEVARRLSLGRATVYSMIASGELPSMTIGSARRVPTEALQKWIAEHVDAGAVGRR